MSRWTCSPKRTGSIDYHGRARRLTLTGRFCDIPRNCITVGTEDGAHGQLISSQQPHDTCSAWIQACYNTVIV
jgi:hypothetical protein